MATYGDPHVTAACEAGATATAIVTARPVAASAAIMRRFMIPLRIARTNLSAPQERIRGREGSLIKADDRPVASHSPEHRPQRESRGVR